MFNVFFFMNKTFNTKKADTTVPAFRHLFSQSGDEILIVIKVIYFFFLFSFNFFLFIQFPHAAVFGVFHLKASFFQGVAYLVAGGPVFVCACF